MSLDSLSLSESTVYPSGLLIRPLATFSVTPLPSWTIKNIAWVTLSLSSTLESLEFFFLNWAMVLKASSWLVARSIASPHWVNCECKVIWRKKVNWSDARVQSESNGRWELQFGLIGITYGVPFITLPTAVDSRFVGSRHLSCFSCMNFSDTSLFLIRIQFWWRYTNSRLSGRWVLSESAAIPVSRSYGCFCSSCRSLSTRSWSYEWEELVNFCVTLGDLVLFRGTSNLVASLNVGIRGLALHKSDLFLCC